MNVLTYIMLCAIPMAGMVYTLIKWGNKHPDYRNKYNKDYQLFVRKGDNPYNLH